MPDTTSPQPPADAVTALADALAAAHAANATLHDVARALLSDSRTHAAMTDTLTALGLVPTGRSYWEYGIETQWGMSWGASTGPSHHYEYTAENVRSLASGRPVWRRQRTTYPTVLGDPERVTP